MKRTTIKIPDDLDTRLRHEARRKGTSVSAITREAISQHLGGPKRTLMAAAAGRSGRTDVSERIEEILRKELS
jgi:predicted transcriptional regulator